jgi:streptomycin 6-kinase
MTKADIVSKLQATEAMAYAHMTKALNMFGESSQLYYDTRIKWEMAYGILSQCSIQFDSEARKRASAVDQGVVFW